MFKLTDIRRYYLYRGLIKRIVVPIVFIYFLANGLSLVQIGYIIAISTIVGIILEVPSGAIADMLGHKRTLITSSLLQALSMLLFIVLPGFYGMLIAATVYWGSGTLMTGTHDAFFYELLEKRKQTHLYKKYWGRAFAVANGMGVIFLSISSLLYAIHPYIPFVIGVLQFILSAYFIHSIKDGSDTHSVEKEEGFSRFWVGVKKNKHLLSPRHPFFWVAIYQASFFGIIFAIAEYHQLFLVEMGFIIIYLGVLYSCKRLLTMISSHYAHVILEHITPIKVFALSTAFSFLLLAFYAFIQSPWVAAVFVVLPSIFWGVLRVSLSDVQNQLITTGSRSSFLSMIQLGDGIVKTITALIIGYAATYISIQMTFFFIPFFVAIPIIIILIFFQRTYSHLENKKSP